jgi:hypothetical protein
MSPWKEDFVVPNDSTTTDLWKQVEPDVLRRMVEVFADLGRGVRVEPVPDREEDAK